MHDFIVRKQATCRRFPCQTTMWIMSPFLVFSSLRSTLTWCKSRCSFPRGPSTSITRPLMLTLTLDGSLMSSVSLMFFIYGDTKWRSMKLGRFRLEFRSGVEEPPQARQQVVAGDRKVQDNVSAGLRYWNTVFHAPLTACTSEEGRCRDSASKLVD